MCQGQIRNLSTDLVEVRLRLEYVEKYKEQGALNYISEGDKIELLKYIAPIVKPDDNDEFAKRSDNFMYGLMLASIEQMPSLSYARRQLCDIAVMLRNKRSPDGRILGCEQHPRV
ncbi:MAG: hypothetical protein LUI61_01975 [Firmicutes bacterium]|nr:hypothetical protein [Bacillota bacterium]